jgi:hypothetical protein
VYPTEKSELLDLLEHVSEAKRISHKTVGNASTRLISTSSLFIYFWK